MTTQYTIKYAGFEIQQQEAISAILDLADSALNNTWLIIETEDCDVLLINLDSESGQAVFIAEKGNRPAYRFILATEIPPDNDLEQYWFLTKKPYAPPSLKELTKLLNEVAVVLGEASKEKQSLALDDAEGQAEVAVSEEIESAQPAAPVSLADSQPEAEPEPETINVETVAPEPRVAEAALAAVEPEPVAEADNSKQSPELVILPKTTPPLTRPLYAKNYLFGILVQARKDKACRTIKYNKLPTLYLSPSDDCYYFWGSATDLLAYCTAMPQYLEEATITKSKLTKMLRNGLLGSSQPLDNLIAYSIIEASQGRLLGSHSPDQSVIMIEMPSAGIINLLTNFKDIAQFMYKQPRTLFQVAEELRIPLSTIFEFYNVCYLLGYLIFESPSPKTEPTMVVEEKKSGKLGHFLKTFFNK